MATAIASTGRPVPAPITGAILVDTGATTTCISEQSARDLGLRPVDTQETYGAGGKHTNNVYAVHLELRIHQNTIGAVIRASGIPSLEQTFQNMGVKINGRPVRVIGLLGRDMLRFCKMTYNGLTGDVDYRFDLRAMGAKPGN